MADLIHVAIFLLNLLAEHFRMPKTGYFLTKTVLTVKKFCAIHLLECLRPAEAMNRVII